MSRTDALLSVVLSLLAFYSLVADSQVVGRKMPSIGHFLVLCSLPVAVPGYLAWTRRWKGIGLFAALAFTWWLVYYVTALTAFGVRFRAPMG